jgi:hypothetical protein
VEEPESLLLFEPESFFEPESLDDEPESLVVLSFFGVSLVEAPSDFAPSDEDDDDELDFDDEPARESVL